MITNKINILEDESLIDELSCRKIYPAMQSAGLDFFRKETISLFHLYDADYWGQLKSVHRIDIAYFDPMLWHADDKTFHEYVKKFASIKFPIVCIFEDPYGSEMPLNVSVEQFEKKLFERTKIAVQKLKSKNSKINILSPAINHVQLHRNVYRDYFIHHRNMFDTYAVHCCNDMSQQSLSSLNSFLSEVLQILPKSVWVTRWAIPSIDESKHKYIISDSKQWKPLTYSSACERMRHSFIMIESITKNNSKWFFTGIGKDAHSASDQCNGNDYWNLHARQFMQPSATQNCNDFYNFLGLMDSDNKIKQKVLDAFLSLCKSHNV